MDVYLLYMPPSPEPKGSNLNNNEGGYVKTVQLGDSFRRDVQKVANVSTFATDIASIPKTDPFRLKEGEIALKGLKAEFERKMNELPVDSMQRKIALIEAYDGLSKELVQMFDTGYITLNDKNITLQEMDKYLLKPETV